MRQIVFSVPTGTFPADIGDRVRVSLTGIDGLEMIEAFVNSIIVGCGVSDIIDLYYDETLLPEGIEKLSKCNLTGFQEICDCCSARPCMEVFAPTEVVENLTRYVMTLPGPFRLDAVKFYIPNPAPAFYGEQIVDGIGNDVADESGNLLTT